MPDTPMQGNRRTFIGLLGGFVGAAAVPHHSTLLANLSLIPPIPVRCRRPFTRSPACRAPPHRSTIASDTPESSVPGI